LSEKKSKVLAFMKPHYTDIEAFLRANFDCTIFKGDWGDPFPDIAFNDEGLMFPQKYNDGHLKLPDWILKHAEKGAINFHPGPPKYPGIGCYNYAIWNEDEMYGVTCHFMDEKLDHGKIINCYYFDLIGNETINTLKNQAITKLKNLFYSTINLILQYGNPVSLEHGEEWGEYKSKKDFEACCRVEIQSGIFYGLGTFNPINFEEQWEKFLRAFYYPGANEGPFIEINGKKWRLVPK
jgi:hypothetical protein